MIRDAFYGVRRFSDFRAHLNIPKAVLSEGLSLLIDEGVLTKAAGGAGRDEYALTPKGRRRWPTIWSLISWGNENYVDQPHRRSYRHAECGGAIGPDRLCADCGQLPTLPTSSCTRRADHVTAATTRSAQCCVNPTECWSRSIRPSRARA